MATVAAVSSLGGFALNPRGNIWLNDESTLGHKLLKKMGWSKGKGLGKNEDGIKENIKVKFRSTTSGVGFKDESFFKVQNTEYDSLLKSISENCAHNGGATLTSERAGTQESLEERPPTFGNRLRYRKFLRAKDLSQYSDRDMKSIFIVNKVPEENMETSVKENSAELKKESESNENMNTSRLSITDYFAQKMKVKNDVTKKTFENSNLLQNVPVSNNIEKENTSLPSVQTLKIKKRKKNAMGSSSEDSVSESSGQNELIANSAVPTKKRKNVEDLNYDNTSNHKAMNDDQTLNYAELLVPPKKKKKSKASVVSNEEDVVCNKVTKSSEESSLSPSKSVEIIKDTSSNKLKKRKKSRKHKLKYLTKLKSCLKSKKGKYTVKNVTFNENVSYQLIEPIIKVKYDSSSEVNEVNVIECVSLDAENVKNDSLSTCEKDSNDDNQCANHPVDTDLEENSREEDGCSISNLPSRKSDHFNSWIESQRLAMKMEDYKNMLKNMKIHEILRTTNLLSIRGYGNWGF